MLTNAEKNPINIVKLHRSKVFDENGNETFLGRTWEKNPVILIFLRHFACMACRSHAQSVWEKRELYQKAGAELIFVGNGSPHMIKVFKEDLNLGEAKILTDPSLESFYAAGFKRGFIAAVGPAAMKNVAGIYFKSGTTNSKYTKESGDLWQLGGVLAVKPGDIVTYHYISQATGDFPPEEEIKNTPWISR